MQMSETINDESAGLNGSFEVVKSGLPVNWSFYSPNTVSDGDFSIEMDTNDYVDGKQSLKFEVVECSSQGGLSSPGMMREFAINPGNLYKLSFWIKNEGCKFKISSGGVSPKTGDVKKLIQTSDHIHEWKLYEYNIDISKEYESLRFEINILQPGTFWIDNIKIDEV